MVDSETPAKSASVSFFHCRSPRTVRVIIATSSMGGTTGTPCGGGSIAAKRSINCFGLMISTTTGGNPVLVNLGDILTLTAPATQDAALADLVGYIALQ